MAERVSRGDVWLYEFQAPDKQRPVLVLMRQEVIGLLRKGPETGPAQTNPTSQEVYTSRCAARTMDPSCA
jgi:hypothetical protein